MSRKGGHSRQKHGGAHGLTHGSAVVVSNRVVTCEYSGKNSYFGVESIGEAVDCIQDGGHGGCVAEDDHVGSELMASASTTTTNSDTRVIDNIGIEGLEAGGTAQLVGNAEWLKNKLGQLGGVFVIQNGVVSASGEGPAAAATATLEASENDGMGRLDLREVRDISELFTAEETLQANDNGIGISGATILNVESALSLQNVFKTKNRRKNDLTPSASSFLNGGRGVANGRLEHHGVDTVTGLVTDISVSDKTDKAGLNSQYRACLEEIEKGSQLSPEEKELLENSRHEFQALEFQSIHGDKSNMLMTPQELEQMPEGGLEFEESVGPKSDLSSRSVSPSFTDLEALVASSAVDSCVTNNGTATVTSTHPPVASKKRIRAERTVPVGLCKLQPGANEQTSSAVARLDRRPLAAGSSVANGSNQNNQDLGRVSIATDSASNSTQILVNTPQGQQIFHINTADLNQATSTLQPLALQGGMVGMDTTGKVVNSGTVDGITIEDGFLVIPVHAPDAPEDEQHVVVQNPRHIPYMDCQLVIPVHAPDDPEDEQHIMLQDSRHISYLDGELGDEGLEEGSSPPMPGRLWICQEENCGELFSKLSKLKIHLMRHTGERPFKCSLQGCDWAFTTGYKLKRHEESHQKRKDYICDAAGCERRFTTIYNLNTHRKLHERPCTEECPECGTRFPTMRKLDLHMKNHRGAQKTYKCPMEGCNKMFFSPHCMGSHTRVHQQDRDLTCKFEGCGKVFDKLCRLKQHMRSHTGEKPYICNVDSCGWAFSTASKLKRHQRKHTGERKWVCPEEGCNKAFMRAEHLKGHLVTHSGEKPFICQIEGCDARFTAKSSMYVHIKKHSEADKKVTYFCPLDGCDKKYNSKTTLRSHIGKHYQNAIALATTNTGDLGNLIPMLGPEELQVGLDSLIAVQGENAADAANDAIVASVNSILSPDAAINHTDLIVRDNGNITSASQVSDLLAQPVTNSMVTQLIVAGELGGVANTLNVSSIPVTVSSPEGAVPDDKPKVTVIPDPTVKFLASELENSAGMQQYEESGSARTDYHSNIILSDRARKRQKTKKENSDTSSTASSLDLANVQELADRKASFSVDTSAGDPFTTSDLVTSSAITFRDPETGAIYVQTQLLQDDPPNPDLYSDDTSLDASDQPGMTQDMAVNLFSIDGDSDDAEEFTSTTINLQDLA